MKLSAEQTAFFHREGYLVVDDVFDDADLQPPIDDVEQAINRVAAELKAAGELTDLHEDVDFNHRLTYLHQQSPEIFEAIRDGKLHGPGFFELIINPKLLDVVESLVGTEIIASSAYRVRPKLPGYGRTVVPWHQDSAFFEPYCDKSLIVTVWIPLIDATAERGCLQVIPRAHTGEIVKHWRPENTESKLIEIHPDAMPEGEIVTVPVRKGGLLLLTNRTPHRSIENKSDIIRWSMDLRYQSAGLPTNFVTADGELFRERLDDHEPIACYPPEADFLVRSQKRPQDVVTEWARMVEVRTTTVGMPAPNRWNLQPS